MRIGNKKIGNDVFIIAELSANHNQDYNLAEKTIKAAKEAGADAVKVQNYKPDTITIDCDNEYFQIKHGTLWDGTTLYKLYEEAYMPWEWTGKLQKVAQDLGLIFFSAPFDVTAVDLLKKLDVLAYKIASYEVTDIPLIEKVAATKKPIFLSTGLAEIEDIELFIETCKKQGNEDIILLKCTSDYPAKPENMNLLNIPELAERFNKIVGLSDHSLTLTAPIAAVVLGAKVIEKHIILERNLGGIDSKFSLTAKEFKEMVDAVRETEKMLKKGYGFKKKNKDFCKSLFVVKEIKKGELFSEENVKSIRPGQGMHPKHYKEILGKKTAKDIKRGTPLAKEHIIEG